MLTDLETWLLDNSDEYKFNVFVKKHSYTPYEWDKKFSDESNETLELENVHIEEAITLPNGDVLIGFYWYNEEDKSDIYYYKLSEIRLERVNA